jgi:hypothetical protein
MMTLKRHNFRSEHTATRALLAIGREKFAADLHVDVSVFDQSKWDVRGLRDRSTTSANSTLYFTRHGTLDQPLPSAYGDIVKSWLILDRRSVGNMSRRLDAARILWEAIERRRKGKGEAFTWQNFSEEDLSQAELLMRASWSESTTYKMIVSLVVLTRFLAARGVCRPLYYTPQTPRVEDFNRHTIYGQQERRDRLPTDAALHGIADIYREHAKEPVDRLRVAAVAILVVTGFRIGELLTLPLDCEVEEVRGGKPRYGIRYYKEKARGGEKMFALRWLTATGAELARKAIQEIRILTQEARERAQVLEGTPHRVPIPGFHWAARMTSTDVARVLGVQQLPRALPRHRDEQGVYYRASEVEGFLRSRRGQLWTVDRRDGTFQMLSETLLITFRNFFHPEWTVCPLFVQPMRISQIADFLSGGGGTPSAFERFDIREADGSFCRITSHQFRHWLNYIADKGGLPVDLQSRWMGREHSQDTDAYRHATVDERLEWVKAGIREGQLAGSKATMYFELEGARQKQYLDGDVQAVHFTALGVCLHDFAVTPCPYHLNCVRGCADYLRVKGCESERRRLIQIQQATEQALVSAQAFATGPDGSVAEAWIRHCEETLEGLRAALAVDDQINSAEAGVAQPFHDHEQIPKVFRLTCRGRVFEKH